MTKRWLILLGVGVLGCGPQRIAGLDDGVATDATSSTDAGSETTTETDTETTQSTESEGTESTTDDPTGPVFIPETEDHTTEDCDPFEQNCPEGEKCVAYSSTGSNWDANKCVQVLGDQQPGELCMYGGIVEATDDCDATSACWDVMDVDGEYIGVCAPFCTGSEDAPECPPGWSCLIGGNRALAHCIDNCDPILQDCGPNLGCFWTGSDFQCVFATEDLPTGSPCGFINECAPGNICTMAESLPSCLGDACCSAFCDLEQGDLGCAEQPGTACVPFFDEGMAPPGYEEVGQCVLL